MRRLSYMLCFLLLMLASCIGEQEAATGPHIELTLTCDEAVLSKAGKDGTKDGVDRPYNENYMGMVDFFFYPGNNPDRDADAVYHIRKESGKQGSDVFRIEVTSEIINTLIFPTSTEPPTTLATVFAIVNYDGVFVADENNLAGTSINALEGIMVETDFVSPANHAQGKFLMSGKSVIQLIGRRQIMTATGDIDLARFACKLTTGVNVAERVVLDDGQVWVPMLEGMEIYLVNGVKTVTLAGEDPLPEYFSYYQGRKRFVNKDAMGNYTPLVGIEKGYYMTYPMYMYPQSWTYGSKEGYDREPYLKLVVPWARLAEGGFSYTQKQLYYKIVMPDDPRPDCKCKFVRNNWYHINIDVGMLGSETDEATVTVDPSTCYIVSWQGEKAVEKDVEIGNARYLTVEKDSIVLNNIDSYEVNYTTSHPVVIKPGSISVTRPYYGKDTVIGKKVLGGKVQKDVNGTLYQKGSFYLLYEEQHRRDLNNGEDWFSNSGTYILFDHQLDPDYVNSAMFDYSPYTVTFTLVHEDRQNDTRYMRDIYIKQYPAIYIEAKENSDTTLKYVGKDRYGNKDNWNKQIHTSDYWGFVYVDNEQLYRPDIRNADIDATYMRFWADTLGCPHANKEEYHWRIVWSTSKNHNMYKIDVTVLPPNTSSNALVIGDPRTAVIDNLRNDDTDPDNDFNNGPALYDGEQERSLKYYYPAENSQRTVNMVAPRYIIASKCGGVEFGNLTLNQAKWRCATYQEDGYPAGRWRLPTQGEILFISTLSAKGAFEPIFSNGSQYWSANGGVRVGNGSVSTVNPSTALSRCVYDSWYWGDEQHEPRTEFVWGDEPR